MPILYKFGLQRRVFAAIGSGLIDDGTGAAGNALFVSWPFDRYDELFMNASLW
jgi:hypothetical protein